MCCSMQAGANQFNLVVLDVGASQWLTSRNLLCGRGLGVPSASWGHSVLFPDVDFATLTGNPVYSRSVAGIRFILMDVEKSLKLGLKFWCCQNVSSNPGLAGCGACVLEQDT